MDKKTLVIFDIDSTGTKQVFDNNWEIESRVITQTATEENLIFAEKIDSGSRLIYIGDQKEIQQRVEVNGGFYFSSAVFITITQAMVSASLTSSFGQNTGTINKIENPRIVTNKIRKLKCLGVHFKIPKNDIY